MDGCLYFQLSSGTLILWCVVPGRHGLPLHPRFNFIGFLWHLCPNTGGLHPRHFTCDPPPHTRSQILQSPRSTICPTLIFFSFLSHSFKSNLSRSSVKLRSTSISFLNGSLISLLFAYCYLYMLSSSCMAILPWVEHRMYLTPLFKSSWQHCPSSNMPIDLSPPFYTIFPSLSVSIFIFMILFKSTTSMVLVIMFLLDVKMFIVVGDMIKKKLFLSGISIGPAESSLFNSAAGSLACYF